MESVIYLFINLLNFNYTDLNIQIEDKLTIKINKKKKMKKITRSEQLGQFIQNTKIPYKNKLPQLKNIYIYIYIYIYIQRERERERERERQREMGQG